MEPDNQTTYIISSAYDGRTRKLFLVHCAKCGADFYRPKHVLKSVMFCSTVCSSSNRRTQVVHPCAQCGACVHHTESRTRQSKSGLVFCNRRCKEKAQRVGGIKAIQPGHYNTGDSAYRVRALGVFGGLCQRCGYGTDPRMLDVHHRDGNRSNNRLDNLEVLCVWCHALETRGVDCHPRTTPTVG